MFSLKKASFLLSITLLATSYHTPLSSQSASMTDITRSSSEGITFGTMNSAFIKDLRFEQGVQLVVEAAVELLDSSVKQADNLGMNPRNFFDPVVLGIEESIKTRSKEVGLQKKEEDILYKAVMDALQKRLDILMKLYGAPPPPPPPPPPLPVPDNKAVTTIPPSGLPADPPKTTDNTKKETTGPKTIGVAPTKTSKTGFLAGDYYLSTFISVGGSDAASFNNKAANVPVDPGTTWGYGLAVGVARVDNTRVELEASWRGSSANAKGGVASGLDVSYYSLMANAYKDFEIGAVNNLDAFVGFGLGISIANLSGNVNNYGVFGHLPETGEAALAYQMIIGASYNYTDDLSLYMAYRLFNTEDFNHYNPDPIHMFEIGLRKDL